MSQQLVLVHWHASEATALAAELSGAGWSVVVEDGSGTVKMRDLKVHPPLAVIISLRRLPSHGREWADALWYTKWGRQVPLLFVDGQDDKVTALRQRFPAARFLTWLQLGEELQRLTSQLAPGR